MFSHELTIQSNGASQQPLADSMSVEPADITPATLYTSANCDVPDDSYV